MEGWRPGEGGMHEGTAEGMKKWRNEAKEGWGTDRWIDGGRGDGEWLPQWYGHLRGRGRMRIWGACPLAGSCEFCLPGVASGPRSGALRMTITDRPCHSVRVPCTIPSLWTGRTPVAGYALSPCARSGEARESAGFVSGRPSCHLGTLSQALLRFIANSGIADASIRLAAAAASPLPPSRIATPSPSRSARPCVCVARTPSGRSILRHPPLANGGTTPPGCCTPRWGFRQNHLRCVFALANAFGIS
jgi:hypothetical protein